MANNLWLRKGVALRISDEARLKRIGATLYPGQSRVDSTVIRAALIALEQMLKANNGRISQEVAVILRAEKRESK